MYFYKFPQSPGCFTANSQDFIMLFYFRAYAAYEDSIEVCPATEHEERKLLVVGCQNHRVFLIGPVCTTMILQNILIFSLHFHITVGN